MPPNNPLTVWGNEKTMNLNTLVLTNIQSSPYFKVALFELKTYHEVIDEIYYKVSHLEPWEKGSRKTAGQTGMCGGVRGVGAGGIVSSAFCLLYKLYTLKLTKKQVIGLITHKDSPYIRGLGFMYIRFTQPPPDLWPWYEDYLDDEEHGTQHSILVFVTRISVGDTNTYPISLCPNACLRSAGAVFGICCNCGCSRKAAKVKVMSWRLGASRTTSREEIDVKAGSGHVMTIGEMLRQWLVKLEWYATLFPRIPVPIQKDLAEKLKTRPPVYNEPEPEPEHIPDNEVSFGEAERRRGERDNGRDRDNGRAEHNNSSRGGGGEGGGYRGSRDHSPAARRSPPPPNRYQRSSSPSHQRSSASRRSPPAPSRRSPPPPSRRSPPRRSPPRSSGYSSSFERDLARERERQQRQAHVTRDKRRSRSRSPKDRREKRSRSRDRKERRSRSPEPRKEPPSRSLEKREKRSGSLEKREKRTGSLEKREKRSGSLEKREKRSGSLEKREKRSGSLEKREKRSGSLEKREKRSGSLEKREKRSRSKDRGDRKESSSHHKRSHKEKKDKHKDREEKTHKHKSRDKERR